MVWLCLPIGWCSSPAASGCLCGSDKVADIWMELFATSDFGLWAGLSASWRQAGALLYPKFVWIWGEHRGALSVWTACEVCWTSPCKSHFNCDLCLLQFSQGCWSHARCDRGVCRHGHWLPSFMCDFCKTGGPKLSSSGSSGSVWLVYTRILREQAACNTTSYWPSDWSVAIGASLSEEWLSTLTAWVSWWPRYSLSKATVANAWHLWWVWCAVLLGAWAELRKWWQLDSEAQWSARCDRPACSLGVSPCHEGASGQARLWRWRRPDLWPRSARSLESADWGVVRCPCG